MIHGKFLRIFTLMTAVWLHRRPHEELRYSMHFYEGINAYDLPDV